MLVNTCSRNFNSLSLKTTKWVTFELFCFFCFSPYNQKICHLQQKQEKMSKQFIWHQPHMHIPPASPSSAPKTDRMSACFLEVQRIRTYRCQRMQLQMWRDRASSDRSPSTRRLPGSALLWCRFGHNSPYDNFSLSVFIHGNKRHKKMLRMCPDVQFRLLKIKIKEERELVSVRWAVQSARFIQARLADCRALQELLLASPPSVSFCWAHTHTHTRRRSLCADWTLNTGTVKANRTNCVGSGLGDWTRTCLFSWLYCHIIYNNIK